MESLLAWDQDAFLALNQGLGTPALDAVMRDITHLGDGLPLLLILLCCAFIGDRAGRRGRLLLVALGLLPGAIAVQAVKTAVARPRPIPTFAALGVPIRAIGCPPRGNTSWPSGHAQGAFGAAVILGAIFHRLRWPLLAGATLVAFSRIYVGAHFPLDVLGGMAIGLAGGFAGLSVWRRLSRRKSE
jgi:undecaprenyl-diphosphatase